MEKVLKESAGWIAIWNGKKCEIGKDEARDLWGAKQLAIKKLGVPKSKVGELAIDVAFEDDEDGVSNAQFESLKDLKDDVTYVLKNKKNGKYVCASNGMEFESEKSDYAIHFTKEKLDAEWNLKNKEDYDIIKVNHTYTLEEEKDIEVKDIEKMTELEPGDEVEVTKEMDNVFDKSLEMAKEFGEEPKLETFDEQMDFLAKDEQEAIDGYEKVIALVEDEHVKEQLEKILVEEKAHKEFLEAVKSDHSLEYSHEEHEEKDEKPTEVQAIEEPEEDEEIIDDVFIDDGDDLYGESLDTNLVESDDCDDDFGCTIKEEVEPIVEKKEIIDWDNLDCEDCESKECCDYEEIEFFAGDEGDIDAEEYIKENNLEDYELEWDDYRKGYVLSAPIKESKEEKHVCEKCGKEICECDKLAEEKKHGVVKGKRPWEINK